MEREDIEKAAKDYSIGKTYFRRSVLKEVDADDYVLRKDNCREDFIAGANWRINSVWHDAGEQPDRGKEIVVMYSNKSCKVFIPNGVWDILIKVDKFIKWAYIEDLLPNMEG